MLRKRIVIGLISVLLILVSYTIIPNLVFANPDNTTLYVNADAFVYDVVPNNNYGTGDGLQVRTCIGTNVRSFLRFDLSDLPEGVTISLAILRISCFAVNALSAPVTNIQARRVLIDSWIEDEITWNNQPDYGVLEDTKVPSVSWVEWTVTSYIQDEWDGNEVVSFCMKSYTEDYDGTARYSNYRAREYDGGSVKSELYVEYEIADSKPFYSDIGYNNITQVNLNADFWCYWEDDLALDTCYFSTNNTGSWYNHTLSVSGIADWGNKTLQLNFTASIRVEYKWFCSDNASQWNATSTYFLVTTPLYITFNFNNSTMGKFYVNYVNTANETQNSYNYNESILLDGIPLSSNYSFINFTWTGGNSLINDYDYYTSGNNTVWCYFDLSGVGGIDEGYFVLGFVITGCSMLFILIVVKGKNKKEVNK